MQLATKDSELSQEKQLKDDLLRHTEAASLYHETEKKLKAVEEKFTKLKDVYTKLREEHITLIRQKAGIEKELRGGDKMVKFARAANQLICSIVRPCILDTIFYSLLKPRHVHICKKNYREFF
ncbi:hypothetical protein WDU94_003082 [Cyamophila willieti]